MNQSLLMQAGLSHDTEEIRRQLNRLSMELSEFQRTMTVQQLSIVELMLRKETENVLNVAATASKAARGFQWMCEHLCRAGRGFSTE